MPAGQRRQKACDVIRRVFVPIAFLSCSVPAAADTLREAIEAAYMGNPQLAAARAFQEAQEEAPEQARALGRPTASADVTASYNPLGYGRSGVATVQFDLPIWTGGRVATAVRAADREVAAGAEGLRDTEASILLSVVVAFANLQYSQEAVQMARISIERLDRQVAEARSRFELGQTTRTDVAQLEAQQASVVAGQADAEGALANAAATYRALVGREPGTLPAEVPPPTGLPRTLSAARAEAERSNPQLGRQDHLAEAAAARVDQARAERAPTFGLTGSYGRGATLVDGDVHGFDAAKFVGLTVRLPLSTGGLISSRVRQAQATLRAERFGTDAALREVVRATEEAWFSLIAAEGRLKANTSGLAAADLALRGVRLEYGFGLRTTLDIVVADQSFRSAQLAVARARADVLIAQASLLRGTGQLRPDVFAGS